MFLTTLQTKEYTTEFHLPEDVYQTKCDSKGSYLSLISKDGVLEIHLILKLQVIWSISLHNLQYLNCFTV